jgi:hypothetical protein
MGTWTCTLLLLTAIGQPTFGQKALPKPANRVAQAEALYAKRDDLAHVREAIRLIQLARAADRANFEVAWRTAKFCYYLAAHTSDEKERDQTFKSGIEAGAAAVALQPGRPEGHFWRGANLGGRARSRGGLGALNSADEVRREMEAVIKADPGYQDGSAYMILGQIDLQVPGFFGGSKKRAVERLEKGLSFGGQNAFLRLRLAEAYLAVHRNEDARRQLADILSMKPDPGYIPEYKEAVAEAHKLLEEQF